MKYCTNCDGKGYVSSLKDCHRMRCPVCNGRGVVFEEGKDAYGGVDLANSESVTVTRMSRRAKMRAMTDEQLAEYLVESAEELTAPDGDYHKHAERFALGWLQQEVEE